MMFYLEAIKLITGRVFLSLCSVSGTKSVHSVCVCCVLADSTDDDGIKAYHWEEVSGPLQEHQIDDDTQTLKLKDMAPGTYVFRSVVRIGFAKSSFQCFCAVVFSVSVQ